MANPEHVAKLNELNIQGWNQWRFALGEVAPDLSDTDLRDARFERRNLSGINFTGAIVSHADFDRADLTGADFTNADMNRARLGGADAVEMVNFTGANLFGAILAGLPNLVLVFRGKAADPGHLSLRGAIFRETRIGETVLGIWT